MPDACLETVVADAVQLIAEFDVTEPLSASIERLVQTLLRFALSMGQSGTDEGQERGVVGQVGAASRKELVAAIWTGVVDLAERPRGRLANAAVETNGITLAVTANFGVWALDGGIGGVAEWLQLADDRLYGAEAGDRNGCCGG